MAKHSKHTKLKKPDLGHFSRNEIALLGAPCSTIQQFVEKLTIENNSAITYIDADHAFGDLQISTPSINRLTDKIKYFQHDINTLNSFDKKIALQDQSLVLVNGNHFEANQQLVFIDQKKEASLLKRQNQLSNVKAYVLCTNETAPFKWLIDSIGTRPVFKIEEIALIKDFLFNSIAIPKLKGLILAGGKSLRMGEDKSQIRYHGKSQVDYLIQEFDKTGVKSIISCLNNQFPDYETISDKFIGLGPFGAIASAFQEDPNSSWLVVACDLPHVNYEVFNLLIEERDPSKVATCFFNPETGFPDPLIAIWEPKAYMRMLDFLALGYSCPRKVLINSDVKVIQAKNAQILKNVNTPEEKIMVKV